MPYWRLFYHLVWATKGRAAVIDAAMAEVVRRSIRASCRDQGVLLHALGIQPDHVHVVASIPPAIAVATLVGRLKGASSHAINALDRADGNGPFAWQGEYGVLSFGERALADVVAYVEDQPNRHAGDRFWPSLERIDEQDQPASAGLSGSARRL